MLLQYKIILMLIVYDYCLVHIMIMPSSHVVSFYLEIDPTIIDVIVTVSVFIIPSRQTYWTDVDQTLYKDIWVLE